MKIVKNSNGFSKAISCKLLGSLFRQRQINLHVDYTSWFPATISPMCLRCETLTNRRMLPCANVIETHNTYNVFGRFCSKSINTETKVLAWASTVVWSWSCRLAVRTTTELRSRTPLHGFLYKSP